MMRAEFSITKSPEKSVVFAKKFLEKALKDAQTNKPLIFYLEGELGAGKTHFVKGLALGLGVRGNITSPTFVLMKKFVIPKNSPARKFGKELFFHIDCYRIYDNEDARQIGLDKILENPRAVISIEWADRIAEIIPSPYWEIKMAHIDGKKRKISIKKYVRK